MSSDSSTPISEAPSGRIRRNPSRSKGFAHVVRMGEFLSSDVNAPLLGKFLVVDYLDSETDFESARSRAKEEGVCSYEGGWVDPSINHRPLSIDVYPASRVPLHLAAKPTVDYRSISNR
jgi:hypothetical protein